MDKVLDKLINLEERLQSFSPEDYDSLYKTAKNQGWAFMEHGDRVKVKQETNKILNDAMKDWMLDHKDNTYVVDKVVDNSAKLYKVDFWISTDLLEVI